MRYACFALSALMIAAPVLSQWKEKSGKWETVRMTRSGPNGGWNSAWGLGNGRLAAKVMCNAQNERIYLNDNTFWPGYPRDYTEPAALNVLKEIRTLLLAGKNSEANTKSKQLQNINCFPYGFPGNLYLDMSGGSTSNYTNILNLDSAMVQVRFSMDGANYKRDIFISYPDQIIAIRICADKKGGVNLSARMDTKDNQGKSLKEVFSTEGNNTLVMKTYADYAFGGFTGATDMMRCDIRVRALTSGGSASASGSTLKVTGADTAVLLVSIATSYNGPFKHPGKDGLDEKALCLDHLDKAAAKSYGDLLTTHVKDYQAIFRRFWLELGGGNPGGTALDFQYIRFELSQMSRGIKGYPPMLKGIWNDLHNPEFYGHYTINSEGAKNFFFAEAANLGEMLLPMANMCEELAVNGAKTASVNYGCRGWMAHHNTDLWKHTSMVGKKDPNFNPYWCCWMFGGAFLNSLVSDHYKFTGDLTFLKEREYPLIKGVALFCLDYLIDNGKGNLVPAPSSSPENMYRHGGATDVAVCLGSTCDLSNTRQTFIDFMEYSKILGLDAGLRDTIEAAYKKLLPYKVGGKGQLQEWCDDYAENEPGHRHASHIVGVFPLMTITKRGTPEFWAAAKKSMDLRWTNGGQSVYGGGWLPAPEGMWARLGDGNMAQRYMFTHGPRRWVGENWVGFPELFLQSHAGALEILPALPSSLSSGKILGLCGRTGYEVDIEWSNGTLTKAVIRSRFGTVPKVFIQGDSVADVKNHPKITFIDLSTGIEKNVIATQPRKTITIATLSNIAIPYSGNYSASVINIRGQVVESVKGFGPATLRLSPRNWTPGLYVLKITAADGSVSTVKKINHTGIQARR